MYVSKKEVFVVASLHIATDQRKCAFFWTVHGTVRQQFEDGRILLQANKTGLIVPMFGTSCTVTSEANGIACNVSLCWTFVFVAEMIVSLSSLQPLQQRVLSTKPPSSQLRKKMVFREASAKCSRLEIVCPMLFPRPSPSLEQELYMTDHEQPQRKGDTLNR